MSVFINESVFRYARRVSKGKNGVVLCPTENIDNVHFVSHLWCILRAKMENDLTNCILACKGQERNFISVSNLPSVKGTLIGNTANLKLTQIKSYQM